jgi:hypothetical protein
MPVMDKMTSGHGVFIRLISLPVNILTTPSTSKKRNFKYRGTRTTCGGTIIVRTTKIMTKVVNFDFILAKAYPVTAQIIVWGSAQAKEIKNDLKAV